MSSLPYYDLNRALRERFGCRVQKVSLDAGLSCPNRDGRVGRGGCIYCNARGSGTGASAFSSITEQLEKGMASLRRRYKAEKFIAYFQSFSNTYAPPEELRRLYEEALAVPDVEGLAIGTRPDCIDEEVLDLLEELSQRVFLTMEYGLQSIHDRTLERIHRGHTFAVFKETLEKTRRRGVDVCIHIILGLPGEGRQEMLETAEALARMDIQAVKVHLLYVVRGTALHRLYDAGEYRCLDRETYASIVAEFLSFLPPGVVIHRLTGDPHPGELVAPLWALEKQTNLQAIRDAMKKMDLWQGKNYKGFKDPSNEIYAMPKS
jgi:radical SAM protein (TIGR01212 family)